MPSQIHIAKRSRTHASLLIVVICAALSACASRPVQHEAIAAEQQRDGAVSDVAAPRLRRESVAHVATSNAFGNLAIESSIDAPCGYRDVDAAVICLNVAGELNTSDLELLRARLRDGAATRVHDASARELIHRLQDNAASPSAADAITVRTSTDCRGACAGRIELVRAR